MQSSHQAGFRLRIGETRLFHEPIGFSCPEGRSLPKGRHGRRVVWLRFSAARGLPEVPRRTPKGSARRKTRAYQPSPPRARRRTPRRTDGPQPPDERPPIRFDLPSLRPGSPSRGLPSSPDSFPDTLGQLRNRAADEFQMAAAIMAYFAGELARYFRRLFLQRRKSAFRHRLQRVRASEPAIRSPAARPKRESR